MGSKRTSLKVFRIMRNLTQAEFAEKLGYSRSQYALIEQGKRNGTQDFWQKLQEVFSVNDCAMWELMKTDEE